MKDLWHLLKNTSHLLIVCLMGASTVASGSDARIAVAANFKTAAERLAVEFTSDTSSDISYSFGSTGQLYAQIAFGAPFDAFLSADQARVDQAVRDGLALASTRFTYALGRLSLYSRDSGQTLSAESLFRDDIAHIAIANPKTAPYGKAAITVLERLGALPLIGHKLVRGTSVAQAFQFAFTGNADIAIIARAQLSSHDGEGSHWEIPTMLHAPIAQDAVLLARGKDNSIARDFLAFLQSEQARAIIKRSGYGQPQGKDHD